MTWLKFIKISQNYKVRERVRPAPARRARGRLQAAPVRPSCALARYTVLNTESRDDSLIASRRFLTYVGTNAAVVLLVCSNADRLVACWRPLERTRVQRFCSRRVALVEIAAALVLCALLNAGTPFVRALENGRCVERLARVDGALGVFLRCVQRWLVYACISLLPAIALLSLNALLLVRLVRHQRRLKAVALVMRSPVPPLELTGASPRIRRGRALSAIAVDTRLSLRAPPGPSDRSHRASICVQRVGSLRPPPSIASASASSLSLQVPCLATSTSSPTGTDNGTGTGTGTGSAQSHCESSAATPAAAELVGRRASAKQLRSPPARVSTWSSCGAESSSNPLRRLSSSPVGGASGTRRRRESASASAAHDCERNTYVLTLGISLLFVPLYTPILVLRPFESLFVEQLQRPALYRLLQTSFSMLQHAFHCADFYLYACISHSYRHKLLLVLADLRAALVFARARHRHSYWHSSKSNTSRR